jgi:hypothetical protein
MSPVLDFINVRLYSEFLSVPSKREDGQADGRIERNQDSGFKTGVKVE